jgi:hypothetical protein
VRALKNFSAVPYPPSTTTVPDTIASNGSSVKILSGGSSAIFISSITDPNFGDFFDLSGEQHENTKYTFGHKKSLLREYNAEAIFIARFFRGFN